MVEAITQGRCTECGESDDNYTVDKRTYHERPDTDDVGEWNGIQRDLTCDCGAEATVSITEEGIVTVGPISHDDASWNEEDDEQ
jgi:translation initiation factor 2 beta subunit (eIF-2beta)/eIF-5